VRPDNSGKKNPFYGKSHDEKTINYLEEKGKEVWEEKIRPNYEEWLKSSGNSKKYEEKYGKEKAAEIKKVLSVKKSGENNPMYGRPSPQGSGNGWKGWYDGWFFRSLSELSYVLNVLEKNDLNWKSAEKKKYEVKYKHPDGSSKTYRPDFVVEDKYIVEIKPERLIDTPTVSRKARAANKVFEDFRIRTAPDIDNATIKDLYKSKEIKFTSRYQDLFEKKFISNNE